MGMTKTEQVAVGAVCAGVPGVRVDGYLDSVHVHVDVRQLCARLLYWSTRMPGVPPREVIHRAELWLAQWGAHISIATVRDERSWRAANEAAASAWTAAHAIGMTMDGHAL